MAAAELGQTFQVGLTGRKVFPGAWNMRLCKSGLLVTSMLWYKKKFGGWGVFYILAAVILCIFRGFIILSELHSSNTENPVLQLGPD